MSEFPNILNLRIRRGFGKIAAEVTAAQQVIVKTLKDTYVRQHGLAPQLKSTDLIATEGSKRKA